MKTLKGVLVLCAILITVMVLRGTPVWAQIYLGEFCWSATVTADETGPVSGGSGVLKAGVTHLGDEYYLFHGAAPTGDNPQFFNGTAVVVGSEIWVTGTTAQDHIPTKPYRDGGNWQFRLNASTLSGTFWYIITAFDTSNHSIGPGYYAGTATFIPCP